MNKLILFYKVLFKRTSPFAPIKIRKEEIAEVILALLLLMILVLYPINYLVLVIWRLSEPLRRYREITKEQLIKNLSKP